jgi:hypothetical protein
VLGDDRADPSAARFDTARRAGSQYFDAALAQRVGDGGRCPLWLSAAVAGGVETALERFRCARQQGGHALRAEFASIERVACEAPCIFEPDAMPLHDFLVLGHVENAALVEAGLDAKVAVQRAP